MHKLKTKNRISLKRGLLIVFSLMFLITGIACGKKDTGAKDPLETPVVVAPDTEKNDPVVDEEKTPAEENELTSDEMKDLFKSGKELKEITYTMEMIGYGEQPFLTKVWLKNNKMRFESTIMGQTVISIINEDAFYSISVNEKMAMKMPMVDMDNPLENTFSLDDVTEDVDFNSFKYLGKEKVNGVTCLVVESNDESVGVIKMWLHEKYGLAMKMETSIRDQQGAFVMEVKDFSVGNISDDVFEVPEGYQIMDFGNLEFPLLPEMPDSP